MVSPRASQNEEHRLAVRIHEHLPSSWIRAGWGGTRVISGERDGEWPATGFFEGDGAAPSMVSIRAHAGCHRHTEGIENRGDRARHSADTRLDFADVVKERCLNRPGVIG